MLHVAQKKKSHEQVFQWAQVWCAVVGLDVLMGYDFSQKRKGER